LTVALEFVVQRLGHELWLYMQLYVARLDCQRDSLGQPRKTSTFGGRTHAASCCGMPHSHTGKQTQPQTNKIDRRPTPTTAATTHRMSFHTQLPQMPQICVIDLKMRQANQSAHSRSANCPSSVPTPPPSTIFDLKCSAWTHFHSLASRVRHASNNWHWEK